MAEMDNVMLMDEGIKVALAYKAGQQHVAKVWRFFGRTFESYTLAEVKKEILEYFPDIAAKNLGVKLHYRDSFVGLISIDTDKDLHVATSSGSYSIDHMQLEF